jgi:CubicO group peptidase (beta-lactamase class C family)
MKDLISAVQRVAESGEFSGVVRIDDAVGTRLVEAHGLADRGHGIACTPDTQFALASAAKGFTALTVLSLVEEGMLSLDTTARSVLGDDLPLIGDGVTLEHLLSHRSGIGDYFDEDAHEDIADYVLAIPPHQLETTEQYLTVLDGFEQASAPGARFAYNNGAYVVLALIAERASGVPFHELVLQRVCGPAGMADTAFLRSDELPGRAAIGYLDATGLRTNVHHLPVRGSGDGGIYSTAADLRLLWTALFAGRIVAPDTVAEMVRPRSDVPAESSRYGMGLWLHETGISVWLTGYDAGVSCWSAHDPEEGATYTVVSNSSEGAWPIAEVFDAHLSG